MAEVMTANNTRDVRLGDRERIPVVVPCPSCARPMGFNEESWQCLACHPIPENIPTCATQKCKRPLTKLGDPWNCWICLKCNKHPEEVNKMQKEEDQRKRRYLDKKLTAEDVSKMIKKEMAGVKDMIREALVQPDYPPTRAEIQTMTATEAINAKPATVDKPSSPVGKPETYMQKAKRLGVQTHHPDGGGMRKKADVMADIEEFEKGTVIADAAVEELVGGAVKDALGTEDSEASRKAAHSPPSDDDEYARGLTEEDMM